MKKEKHGQNAGNVSVSSPDQILEDIQRIGHKLNTNQISYVQYKNNGGIYAEEAFEENFGSFQGASELAGFKTGSEDRNTVFAVFEKHCENFSVILNNKQKDTFNLYYEILIEWNSFMNLTAITEYPEVLQKHFEDSLSLAKVMDVSAHNTLLDVGTGAGFPGIPLKIVYPHLQVVLLDSLGKRVKFLNHVIGELGLTGITAVHARAEDFAKLPEYREQFDLVVSRAVAQLASLSEYCLPCVKSGGYFVSYKSGKVEEEFSSAKHAIQILGGELDCVEKFYLEDSEIERSLVLIKKVSDTPKKYPRKAGLPSREPL